MIPVKMEKENVGCMFNLYVCIRSELLYLIRLTQRAYTRTQIQLIYIVRATHVNSYQRTLNNNIGKETIFRISEIIEKKPNYLPADCSSIGWRDGERIFAYNFTEID